MPLFPLGDIRALPGARQETSVQIRLGDAPLSVTSIYWAGSAHGLDPCLLVRKFIVGLQFAHPLHCGLPDFYATLYLGVRLRSVSYSAVLAKAAPHS